MNNYPKYYICIFIAFILEILSLTINYTEMDWNATLMWFNKSVATINIMFKILDITSFVIHFFFNKFGFRIGVFNPNMVFSIM